MTSQPITAALIGAGDRGKRYGAFALDHPDHMQVVAVAEPDETRRARFAQAHAIPPERQFSSWEDLLAQGQIADTALVCTLDRMHTGPTVAALETGYDVLLEKPMAPTLAECLHLVQTAERTRRLLQICHVLRYAPFFATLHEIVASGRLGKIITVTHRENVIYWHMAHSFVRGHWRNSIVESPMILAKCCHDLDILVWNLGTCTQLSSTGSLAHFRPENAPPGVPQRCTDGCPAVETCPWYAPRLYLERIPLLRMARRSPNLVERWGARLTCRYPHLVQVLRRLVPPLERASDYQGWPLSVVFGEESRPEDRWDILHHSPYSRCIYRCDNDVVDHQVVNLTFASGTSAVLVMQGHSHREARTMRYDGTRATLRGVFTHGVDSRIEIHDHLTGRVERVDVGPAGTGHGGGDRGLMAAFIEAVRDRSQAATAARQALESHLMAFAAEQARVEGTTVSLEPFRRR